MAIWLTVIAILLIALVTIVIGWNRMRRSASPSVGDLPPDTRPRKDTLPMEMGATIRSYMIPNRWLRAPPAASRARAAAAEHPRYSSATLERGGDGSSGPAPLSATPAAQWQLLRGRTRLGRDSDNHVVLDDERVSLHHALITVRDGVYWLEDLGSTNGTFVADDQRVMAAHPLRDGEVIRLGGVVLTFRATA
jgi:hypothetical protein